MSNRSGSGNGVGLINRIGKFDISQIFLQTNLDDVSRFFRESGFIPTYIDRSQAFKYAALTYAGFCWRFDPVNIGTEPPEYQIMFYPGGWSMRRMDGPWDKICEEGMLHV